ncbi:hypothetical protein N5J43_14465 [Pseudomonas nicosulfuronedens]|uniref:Uncharacterized protein n=1 Tax=Pseudomonas nicosulfuronedens TaxID=2571105 RepID=A0A5R9R7B6_9PSED|nr:hypothetical protein [Pseudomonas nicosulfuronedens]MDH1010142.1 hypothetical protein [Pseudomonas nicosulfuronedens]MDH1980158.1 hypothetical protein [Pseudomonas nicosulfuronedens]MDH2025377.1 hypothetical protein [Pseudomonas nicosulfuronedens]TLX78785.1 hypothetical protein FAS41_09600 [Pseudomonas nicosulfuronedens]
MLTGLGVTRLLTSVVATLRSRAVAAIDWLPMLWAASIFLAQLDYWWVVHDLKSLVPQWTYPQFLKLLVSPLLLFFAAALILPLGELKPGESHHEIFNSHGHWALMALGAYQLQTIWEEVDYWQVSLLSRTNLVLLAFAVAPILAFFGSRRYNWVIAGTFLAGSVYFIFVNVNTLD